MCVLMLLYVTVNGEVTFISMKVQDPTEIGNISLGKV